MKNIDIHAIYMSALMILFALFIRNPFAAIGGWVIALLYLVFELMTNKKPSRYIQFLSTLLLTTLLSTAGIGIVYVSIFLDIERTERMGALLKCNTFPNRGR